jgi:hypothetical protein
MLRSRSTLAAPESSIGAQLASLERRSCDSDGRRIKPKASGNYIPVHDDSPAHNAAHRADERLTRHGAYALVWASLSAEQRDLLELMHSPTPCPGAGRVADEAGICSDCDTLVVVTRPPQGRPQCAHCATPVIPDRATCRHCGQPAVRDESGRARPHARGFTIIREMRLADVRPGDGAVLIGHIRDESHALTGWSRFRVTVAATRSDEELAEALLQRGYAGAAGVPYTKSQVRSRIKRANAVIAGHPLYTLLVAEGDD